MPGRAPAAGVAGLPAAAAPAGAAVLPAVAVAARTFAAEAPGKEVDLKLCILLRFALEGCEGPRAPAAVLRSNCCRSCWKFLVSRAPCAKCACSALETGCIRIPPAARASI